MPLKRFVALLRRSDAAVIKFILPAPASTLPAHALLPAPPRYFGCQRRAAAAAAAAAIVSLPERYAPLPFSQASCRRRRFRAMPPRYFATAALLMLLSRYAAGCRRWQLRCAAFAAAFRASAGQPGAAIRASF